MAYLEHLIINDNRHYFIYGYNNEKRTNFLRRLADLNAVKVDFNRPIVIYLEYIGLPKIDVNKELDTNKLFLMAENYLTFNMIYSLIKQVDENNLELNERFKDIFKYINLFKGKKDSDVKSIKELKLLIEEAINYYYDYYINYVKYGIEKDIKDMPIIFADIKMFVDLFKKAINNNGHITFLFDKKEDISIFSTKVINNLLGSRINKDISIKIACEPDKWESLTTINGQLVEYIHDYGTMKFDDSWDNYTRLLKREKN